MCYSRHTCPPQTPPTTPQKTTGPAAAPTPDPAARPICPECGTPFDPAQPWRPKLWPSPFRLSLRCCGPIVLLLAALLAASAFRGPRNLLVWPLSIIWIVAILTCAIAVPLDVARTLARNCEPRISRPSAARRIWAPAILFALLAVTLTLIAFFALL